MSSLEKRWFRSSVQFWIGLLGFLVELYELFSKLSSKFSLHFVVSVAMQKLEV